jgi:prepilin-type N-terminal cleavage/methylation domain-containing protein
VKQFPQRRDERGVTMLEMLVVVLLISVLSAISYPSVRSGISTLRLNGTADEIVTLFNQSLARAGSRQVIAEIWIVPKERALFVRSTDSRLARRVDLPDEIRIAKVEPELPGDPEAPRRFLLYPGGAVPAMAVLIRSADGAQRLIRVDPITGVPHIERPVSE